MLPNTKNMLTGALVGVVIGAVAAGGYCWMSSGSKDTGSGSYTDLSATSYPVTGGAKTKHNRNHKKHNNKSRKHH
jgi:hypothetical protein